jgi:hypothetical protein
VSPQLKSWPAETAVTPDRVVDPIGIVVVVVVVDVVAPVPPSDGVHATRAAARSIR